jgi:ABC-type oligopeptide transport system substrate-binding subunit/class 3 adenylate cyclase
MPPGMTCEERAAQLEAAMAALEAQRAVLGDAVVETALEPLRRQLADLRQAATAEPAPSLEGERKLVTVMFADISGFTALAETVDPEVVRDLMNACFEQLVPIVERFGGTVDKFIGDEIMALFGAPVAHENDPERALRAALEIMDALVEFNAEWDTDLGVHVGINTGLVIAGGIGTRERQAYSVMGDAVNVASRLEEISDRGEILVGPDTHRLTAPLFEFEPLEPIQVKGKAEPVPVFQLLGPRAVAGRVRGIAGLESPLVGRQAEWCALQEAVERLQAGVGGVVTLVGEAGLGKSRLVAELWSEVLTPDPRLRTLDMGPQASNWVEGRCLSYGTSIAYLLWLDLLRGMLGVTVEDPPLVVRDALRERVQALCPQRFDDVYPYLGRLMALPLATEDEATLRDLQGEKLKASTFRAVESLLEGAARQHPLVLVSEDLHWADATSIELLEGLLALTERAPLLFICVFRPETRHGCWRIRETAACLCRHRHIDLWLEPLSAAESEALVGNLLRVEGPRPEPVEGLPPQPVVSDVEPLKARILGHAEGNPFYVEEIIRSLMDSGVIVRDEATGRWRATRDVADITIPDTLQGVLMARIDRLQEDTKRVLQLAAVIGRIFVYRVLEDIAREERELDGHLLALQREEMIRERARVPELEYIFKHHLTQEAAYSGLLKSERRVFHRQVAQALERLFPDRIEEQVGLLAYHWERADEPGKAIEYLLRAGDQARLAYAHGEAIDYYRRGLIFLKKQEKHERAARTLMKLGLTYHDAFDFRQARQAYEEGLALWQRAGGTQPSVPPPPAPHALRVRWGNPPTLDPTLVGDYCSGGVVSQLFSGLVERSPDMDVLPEVAQSWEVLEGGRRYVFQLRDDVCWSDGAPVTAEDFECAWKRVLDPVTGSPAASLLYDVKGASTFHQGQGGVEELGVRALDDLTLVVDLEAPTGYFLHLLTLGACCPVPRHVVEVHGQAWTEVEHIVTNGPFRLDTWQRDASMALVRDTGYHGRSTGNVQRVELLFAEPSAGLKMYEDDGLDVIDVTSLPPAELDRVRQRHAGEHISIPSLGTAYAGFDVSRPPFDDLRVRRALVFALDRETHAEVNRRGYVFPATGGFVPPGMPGHSAGIGLPYDPDWARQLLAEAGYPGGRGFPVVVALVPSDVSDESKEFMQTQWRENLGVDILLERVEWAKLLDGLRMGRPRMFGLAWVADYPDPDSFLRVGFPWEATGWRNEAYDRLLEEARRVRDQAKRMKLYRQADRILVEETAIMPVYYSRLHLLVKPWVSRYPTSATEEQFWKDVVIEPH